MYLPSFVRQLEHLKYLRPLFSLARRLWRWWFAIRCEIAASREMRSRATLVLQCPDLDRLVPVLDAGKVRDGVQVMHNGVLVEKGCYYSRGSIDLFRRTRGIHEPQEEIAFAEVLPHIPPGATMLELGSYWAFYSIWFARTIPGARCHLVEPVSTNLELGPRNFRLNGVTPASVSQRFIGGTPGHIPDGTPVATVDQLAEELGIRHLHLLHADIQSFERAMLDGARQLIAQDRIDYLFVSTHGDDIHASCREFLINHRFDVLLDLPQAACFSVDGILVARRRGAAGPDRISVAHRSAPVA